MEKNGQNHERRSIAPPLGVETLRRSQTSENACQPSPDAFPNLLIRHMKALGLSSAEFVFVSYLTKDGFSWNADCRVSASLAGMHRTTGLAPGTIHKAKAGLVKKGLVQILNTRNKQRTNTYKLMPLRERLAEFANWRLPDTPDAIVDEGETQPSA
jgi:DNA-binding MarR family transcriptional regulator